MFDLWLYYCEGKCGGASVGGQMWEGQVLRGKVWGDRCGGGKCKGANREVWSDVGARACMCACV